MNNVINTIIGSKMLPSFKTTVYNKDKIRQEKICTLLEYLQMGRLQPGQKLHIVEIGKDSIGRECSSNAETLYVGNCTIYHQPNEDSGDDGWDWNHPRMKKYVLEVYEF